MKYLIFVFPGLMLAFSPIAARAVTYTFDSSIPTSGSNFATTNPSAQEGWSINDTTTEVSFLRSGTGGGGDKDVALGGYQSSPTGTLVNLEHDVNIPFAGSSFRVDFSVINRWALNPAPPEPQFLPDDDTFSFGFSSLLTIAFAPTGIEDQRRMVLNGSDTSNGILASDFDTPINYVLAVNFTAGGSDLLYSGSVTSTSDGSSFAFSSFIPGQAGATFDKVSVGWDVLAATGAGAGSNIIQFDNLSVVPEPSALLLGILPLGWLSSRRRR